MPQKTSAYIGQNNLHIPELTVRETLDFSSRCQSVGSRPGNGFQDGWSTFSLKCVFLVVT